VPSETIAWKKRRPLRSGTTLLRVTVPANDAVRPTSSLSIGTISRRSS
jgi:hypothetical protein